MASSKASHRRQRVFRFLRDEGGMFNYVTFTLVLGMLVMGYMGWKFGPAWMQWWKLNNLAAHCAAQMKVKSDDDVTAKIKARALEIAPMGNVTLELDRDREVPGERACSIQWIYTSKHLWGSPIVRQYKVSGVFKHGNVKVKWRSIY